jgi:hypothetical protein
MSNPNLADSSLTRDAKALRGFNLLTQFVFGPVMRHSR